MITITEDALAYIKNYLTEEATRSEFNVCVYDFKILVEKGGCNGMKYSLYPITVAEICEGALTSSAYDNLRVWFKKEDATFIKGASISLEKLQLGYKIRISNESISTKACGCGKSFHLD